MNNNVLKVAGIICVIFSGVAGVIISVMIHHKELAQVREMQDLAYPHVVDNRMATYHYPLSFVAQLKGDPNAGQKVFMHYCVSCHAQDPIVPVNAPRIGVASDWAKINTYSMKEILNDTFLGNKQMPARGGCFECSDELLTEAVHYILNHRTKYP